MARLVVEVLSARDLLATDDHGSASPFVEVDFDGCCQRTQTKTRELHPTWNEKLVFDIQNPRTLNNSVVQVTIYNDRCVNRHKKFLGCVQIPGASVSLLESDAEVKRYPLYKRGFFSHGRGDISLRIYTVRAQHHGILQQRRIRKPPKPDGIKTRTEDAFPTSYDSDSGLDTRSGVYLTPTLYYLRISVIKAQNLSPINKNEPPNFMIRTSIGPQRVSTKIVNVLDGNPIWNQDLHLVVSEETFDDFLTIHAINRATHVSEEVIGTTVVCLREIPQRFDSTQDVQPRWFTLNGGPYNDEKKQGTVFLKLCFDAGYHVSEHYRHDDLQPSANHMRKRSVGSLQMNIGSARDLIVTLSQREDGTSTPPPHAYCVAKYGNKWVRTNTIVNSRSPCWNESYVWDVYDFCTVITIGVFHNCKKDLKDLCIGKVNIQLKTLENNRAHTDYYPLLKISPFGLKNLGELQVTVQLTTDLTWPNIVSLYTTPLLPKMHYLQPLNIRAIDYLRDHARMIVAAHLSEADPPIKKEIVRYMLDPDSFMWSLRKQKANFERLMSLVSRVTAICRWFGEICIWSNPLKTIFTHFLYLALVWYPKLILPTLFLSFSIMGMWNYRFRPRNLPQLDARLSHAETTDQDVLDEEFDAFPTSQPHHTVKKRYDRLRKIACRFQTMTTDIVILGEKAVAILTCTDLRATSMFAAITFVCVVFMYIASFKVAATLFGLHFLRHPLLRSNRPSFLVNLFSRLPSKMDCMLLL